MILLSIGCGKNSSLIYENFNDLCKYFKDKDINIAIYESNLGNMHYTKCILKDCESDINLFNQYKEIFYSYASEIIYNFISLEYEPEILNKLIESNYDYMDKTDIDEIKERCISIVSGNGLFSSEDLVYSMSYRNNVLKKIEEYLQDSSEIIIEGFITFRLKEFSSSLKEIIDRTVEDFVVEREYSEFIKLLKYFLEIQESKYDLINIIVNSDGDYLLKDKDLKDISKEVFEDFSNDTIKGEIDKHDMLVSAIITSAPKKIIIHGVENSKSVETIDTLKSIFGENLVFCKGCEICKKNVSTNPSQKK